MRRIKIIGVPQKNSGKNSTFYSYIFTNKKLLAKSAIYLCCVYQVIQLLVDYAEFKMNTEYRAQEFMNDISFTLCLDEKSVLGFKTLYRIDSKNFRLEEAFIVARRYFHGRYCFSFFKNITFKRIHLKNFKTVVSQFHLTMMKYPYVIYLIAHHDNSPSQFGKLFVLKPRRQSITYYKVESKYSMRRLLTKPYKTDCYNYNSPTSQFISREYCYLNFMKDLELKYCKVNKYWRVDLNYRFKHDNITKCIIPNFTYLNTMCKVDCLDIQTDYQITKISFNIKRNAIFKDYHLAFLYNDILKQRLFLNYLPKFTKIELFSTMGGLIGMWLGLSINNVLFKFLQRIQEFVLFFNFIKKFKLKYNFLNISIYLNMILFFLMLLHLKQLFIKFLSGQKITKINFVDKTDLPDIRISALFFTSSPGCMKVLNNIENNYSKTKNIMLKKSSEFRNMENYVLAPFLFKEIIFEYGHEYFHKVVFPKIINIESCSIIDKQGDYVNCKNNFIESVDYNQSNSIIDYDLRQVQLLTEIHGKNFAKISIELQVYSCFISVIRILENNEVKYLTLLENGKMLEIFYQKKYLRKSLSSLSEECVSLYKNTSYDVIQCKRKFTNQLLLEKYQFNCMPRDIPIHYIEDLKYFGNKFCAHNKSKEATFTYHDIRSMKKNCPKQCEIEFLDANYVSKNYHGAIKINMIPKANYKPILTYHLSMDINKFIYDIGGTIGMWFCVSALTLPDFIYHALKNFI